MHICNTAFFKTRVITAHWMALSVCMQKQCPHLCGKQSAVATFLN